MGYIGNAPLRVSRGGSGATSFGTSNGVVKYDGTNLVASTATIDASNRFVNSSQPAFLAYLGATASDKTGAGATYVLGTDALTEAFDQGSNFNTNGTFTAPVTGIYQLKVQIETANITVATAVELSIITTARTFTKTILLSSGTLGALLARGWDMSVICNMSATDTATTSIIVTGEAGNTVDISGAATGFTFFCGNLVC